MHFVLSTAIISLKYELNLKCMYVSIMHFKIPKLKPTEAT